MYALKHIKKIDVNIIYNSNKEIFTILQVPKLFRSKIKLYLIENLERYASALSNLSIINKILGRMAKLV